MRGPARAHAPDLPRRVSRLGGTARLGRRHGRRHRGRQCAPFPRPYRTIYNCDGVVVTFPTGPRVRIVFRPVYPLS